MKLLDALKSLFVPSKPNQRQQDILAFRTITTLLSIFNIPSNSNVITKHTKGEQDELRVLDALATLLTRQYEIVAVNSMEFQGTDIQVVASVEPADTSDPFHLIISANPRKNAPKKGYAIDPLLSGQDVSLVDPDEVIPAVLSSSVNSEDLLKTFLKTQW